MGRVNQSVMAAAVASSPQTQCRFVAFISYAHADERFAAWLHRRIESFRIPAEQVGRVLDDGRVVGERLAPVFRDRDELTAAESLSAKLDEALDDAAALIVVCSPAAARSSWVNEEVLRFKSRCVARPILPIIIAGEPHTDDECFPPALRFVVDSRGRVSDVPAEPLAADTRPGADGANDASLRVIAGLLEVGFDELKQRDLHRRMRWVTGIAAALTGVTLMTSALAFTAWVAREDAERHRAQSEDLIGFMLGDLRARLQPVGKLGILESVGARVLDYFAAIPESSLTLEGRRRQVTALHQIGEVYFDLGKFDDATSAFASALGRARSLQEDDPGNDDLLFELGQAHYWVGFGHWYRKAFPDAQREFESYLRVSRELVRRAPDRADWRSELGYALSNLGTLQHSRGDLRGALGYFVESTQVFEAIYAETPTAATEREIAEGLSWIGATQVRLGQVEQALASYRREGVILRRLTGEQEDKSLMNSLGHSNRHEASLLMGLGQVDEALRRFAEGRETFEELVRFDGANLQWASGYAQLLHDFAETLVHAGDLQRAGEMAGMARDVVDRLAHDEADTVRHRLLSARIMLLEARIEMARGNPGAATRLAEAVIQTEAGDSREIVLAHASARILRAGHAGAGDALRGTIQRLEALADTSDAAVLFVLLEAYQVRGQHGLARELLGELEEMGFRHPRMETLAKRVRGANQPTGAQPTGAQRG